MSTYIPSLKKLDITPSLEQLDIISSLTNNNVVVNSVAGSGKTTTNMFIAQAYPEKNILLLTYNKKLSFETKNRIEEYGLSNIIVYTYHAFCCSYYVESCKNDTELDNFLRANPPIKPKKIFSYDIIILDEAQDITPLLYMLIWKIFTDNKIAKPDFKICVLGDIHQSIYDYNGADARYIKMAKDIYKANNFEWKNINLTRSYRITVQMCNFLNHVCLGSNRIQSMKVGKFKPIYFIGNPFEVIGNNIFNTILDCINNLKYNPEDIFILAPSVRCKSTAPLKTLANKLTSSKIPIYIPSSDEETVDTNSSKKKLLFSSYHQAKGMERKVVVVLGFSDSYFEFYAKESDPAKLSNPQYVALTRGSELLIIQQDPGCCKFINKGVIEKYASIQLGKITDKATFSNNINSGGSEHIIPVTNYVRNCKYSLYKKLAKFFTIITIAEKDTPIKFISNIKQNGLSESVSELNGIAVPTYYQLKKTGKMDIMNDELKQFIGKEKKRRLETSSKFGSCKLDGYYFINSMEENSKKQINISELLYVVNHYNALRDNVICKVHQITNYNWVSKKTMDECYDRMAKWITPDAFYEKKVSCYLNKLTSLCGCIDIIDQDIIWEIKCVKELDFTHYLQLIMYICSVNEFILWKISVLSELINDYDKRKNILIEYYRLYHKNSTYIEFISSLRNNINMSIDELKEYKAFEEKYFGNLRFRLFNILTNEIVEIVTTSKKVSTMFSMLKNYKDNSASMSDKTFLGKCEKYKKIVSNLDLDSSNAISPLVSDYNCSNNDEN